MRTINRAGSARFDRKSPYLAWGCKPGRTKVKATHGRFVGTPLYISSRRIQKKRDESAPLETLLSRDLRIRARVLAHRRIRVAANREPRDVSQLVRMWKRSSLVFDLEDTLLSM
jgi:hypothetical protein